MKNNNFIWQNTYKFQMILQKNTKNMKLTAVRKISNKCQDIAQYQKALTQAYLMNGMLKLDKLENLQKNMISKEQD